MYGQAYLEWKEESETDVENFIAAYPSMAPEDAAFIRQYNQGYTCRPGELLVVPQGFFSRIHQPVKVVL